MSDIVDKTTRSRMMSGIRGKNTKPELTIRKCLHKQGFRNLLHKKDLPGKPDLVFPRYNAVVFINGCFWHIHDCHLFKMPSTRKEFWETKLSGNRERDQRNIQSLLKDGWRVLVVWECAIKGKHKRPESEVAIEIANWLKSNNQLKSISGTDNQNRDRQWVDRISTSIQLQKTSVCPN